MFQQADLSLSIVAVMKTNSFVNMLATSPCSTIVDNFESRPSCQPLSCLDVTCWWLAAKGEYVEVVRICFYHYPEVNSSKCRQTIICTWLLKVGKPKLSLQMHVECRNSQYATIDSILLKYVAFKRNIHISITAMSKFWFDTLDILQKVKA